MLLCNQIYDKLNMYMGQTTDSSTPCFVTDSENLDLDSKLTAIKTQVEKQPAA